MLLVAQPPAHAIAIGTLFAFAALHAVAAVRNLRTIRKGEGK